ncbi:hypothetical protein P879_05441 [Paragonimus westermani]|uniref:EB domain-containing protein n=1 Tax=Paragonimus westermani TaxID=34504 RepID=A0A8T0D5F9_9TREM|nr:hypothetical protein P879_05441 [Paragonimus westermani]
MFIVIGTLCVIWLLRSVDPSDGFNLPWYFYNNRLSFLGDCKQKDANFCHSLVENSLCNWQRNECFCRFGYVAIREEEQLVCRTLLTELSCRMDSDCIHVDSSICHPGAGRCVCPGGWIYVEQLHACRKSLSIASYASAVWFHKRC